MLLGWIPREIFSVFRISSIMRYSIVYRCRLDPCILGIGGPLVPEFVLRSMMVTLCLCASDAKYISIVGRKMINIGVRVENGVAGAGGL